MFAGDSSSQVSPSELRRLSVIRRYSSVASDLPTWAKDILSSKMGSIEVSAKDSFEIYISSLEGAYPKYDFITFQKRFAEIFTRKAFVALEKINDNRKKNINFYISNDYFWQEFRDLFTVGTVHRCACRRLLSRFGNFMWYLWNRKLICVFGFGRNLAKVGLQGFLVNRRFVSKNDSADVHPIKWR